MGGNSCRTAVLIREVALGCMSAPRYRRSWRAWLQVLYFVLGNSTPVAAAAPTAWALLSKPSLFYNVQNKTVNGKYHFNGLAMAPPVCLVFFLLLLSPAADILYLPRGP